MWGRCAQIASPGASRFHARNQKCEFRFLCRSEQFCSDAPMGSIYECPNWRCRGHCAPRPPTPGPGSRSVMCLATLCSRVELCKTAHFPGLRIAGLPCTLVSYLIQIRKSDPAQSWQMPGAKLPKPPAPVRAVCVRTRPQRRQHLAGAFCFSVGGGGA
jgi:hypothetical protein